jgi:uncharacterized OB-fold protein
MATNEKPLPVLTNLNRPYFEGTKLHELRLQKCDQCGYVRFPVSTHCPKCLGGKASWIKASGRGRVWSFIVMHQKYFKAFAEDLPYNCAMVQLEEGPIMMSTIIDTDHESIHCELPVEVVFEVATDEITIPKFRPTKE